MNRPTIDQWAVLLLPSHEWKTVEKVGHYPKCCDVSPYLLIAVDTDDSFLFGSRPPSQRRLVWCVIGTILTLAPRVPACYSTEEAKFLSPVRILFEEST